MTTTCTMILGDCLEVMPTLKNKSVDLTVADLPYKATSMSWDQLIDLSRLWSILGQVGTPSMPSIFFANLSLMQSLILSNKKHFRYELIWSKARGTNPLLAHKRPMPSHEFMCVFGGGNLAYYSQKTSSQKHRRLSPDTVSMPLYGCGKTNRPIKTSDDGLRHSLSVQHCPADNQARSSSNESKNNYFHPTQKPVRLLVWLIASYSKMGASVLDPTSGSGSCACAAALCGRSSVSIEKDENYHNLSIDRVRRHIRDNLLDVKLEVRK